MPGDAISYLHRDGVLQELHWFKQSYGSWFLGDYVCEGIMIGWGFGADHQTKLLPFSLHPSHNRLDTLNLYWKKKKIVNSDIVLVGLPLQMVAYIPPLQLILFSYFCQSLRKLEWRFAVFVVVICGSEYVIHFLVYFYRILLFVSLLAPTTWFSSLNM